VEQRCLEGLVFAKRAKAPRDSKLILFNTLTRKKEVFQSITNHKVGLYCCGPTVYWYAHIGNFRTFIFEDILRRTLEYNNYTVQHVMNVTDVGHLTSDADTGEDKMEVGARREQKSVWEIAKHYTNTFFDDAKQLNIQKPTLICKATDHIHDMIELVQRLEKKGYTYIIDSGVYFDTSKLKDYGKLTGMTFERLNQTLKAGARVEFNPQKINITDFGLWLFSPKDQKRQMEWDSPWGIGFPGWHIECSAMSIKYLGDTFDIHCGGTDHPPIHHTNELAQSEAATGKSFVNYWLHGAFLTFGEKKMSKSKGKIITVQSLKERGFDPLAYRYLCLTAHYRSQLVFTWENLQAAQNALSTLREHMRRFSEHQQRTGNNPQKTQDYFTKFLTTVNDDLNMPKVLLLMWQLIRNEKNLNNREKYEVLQAFDRILGIDLTREVPRETLPLKIEELIEQREKARKNHDWKTADELREQIKKLGYLIEDTAEGVRWKKTT
jgi:cysteinyl-tRNA synthetase